jgi:hypothetical protein
LQSVDDFFARHLTELCGQPLLAGYEDYSISFEIRFLDRAESWWLNIENGAIRELRKSVKAESISRVQFEITEPVFWEIIHGNLSPQTAFFTRKTNIRGDLFQGMKLAKILSIFFNHYPYKG